MKEFHHNDAAAHIFHFAKKLGYEITTLTIIPADTLNEDESQTYAARVIDMTAEGGTGKVMSMIQGGSA